MTGGNKKNMEAITASLERSLQNCSLSSSSSSRRRRREEYLGSSATADDADAAGIELISDDNHHVSNSDTTLELNSHVSLPYHWEQCLDLKTGEIYYINWRNGMKAKEDPRRAGEYSNTNSNSMMMSRDYESSEEDEESLYDSEESSSESCPSSSKEPLHIEKQNNNNNIVNNTSNNNNNNNNVLVVAGCKSCLMYFMVPKHVEDCPKCSGQLLHFDRSENGSPPP